MLSSYKDNVVLTKIYQFWSCAQSNIEELRQSEHADVLWAARDARIVTLTALADAGSLAHSIGLAVCGLLERHSHHGNPRHPCQQPHPFLYTINLTRPMFSPSK